MIDVGGPEQVHGLEQSGADRGELLAEMPAGRAALDVLGDCPSLACGQRAIELL
jgi:hypothetical protein